MAFYSYVIPETEHKKNIKPSKRVKKEGVFFHIENIQDEKNISATKELLKLVSQNRTADFDNRNNIRKTDNLFYEITMSGYHFILPHYWIKETDRELIKEYFIQRDHGLKTHILIAKPSITYYEGSTPIAADKECEKSNWSKYTDNIIETLIEHLGVDGVPKIISKERVIICGDEAVQVDYIVYNQSIENDINYSVVMIMNGDSGDIALTILINEGAIDVSCKKDFLKMVATLKKVRRK